MVTKVLYVLTLSMQYAVRTTVWPFVGKSLYVRESGGGDTVSML
jgi:hypothetical protein